MSDIGREIAILLAQLEPSEALPVPPQPKKRFYLNEKPEPPKVPKRRP